MWLGRNNVADTQRVVADTEAVLDHHAVVGHRYLVLSILNGGIEEGVGTPGHAAVIATNAALEQGWPDNFVDVRRCLIDTGLARLGITPTPDDAAAMAADAVPPSLRSDALHLTEGGYQVIAACIADRLADRGWTTPADAVLEE